MSWSFTDEDADRLAREGFVVVDGLLGPEGVAAMRAELQTLLDDGAFRPARVGHGAQLQRAEGIRGDRICWFHTTLEDIDGDGEPGSDGVIPGPAVRRYLDALEALRVAIARTCFLSLAHIELHAACYEPGTHYAAHLDTFKDDRRRVISLCYYLNDDWHEDDGGCLRLHTTPPQDVAPLADRLVIFRSGTMLHEVLPVRRRRFSTTGWLGSQKQP